MSNRIVKTSLNFIREPLAAPFGFKGGYLSELWQVVCRIEDENGVSGTGIGVQSVLWSDAAVFSENSQSGGNAAMLSTTQFALKLLQDKPFSTPPAMLDGIVDDVYEYAKKATANPRLRKTFALNALVCVDFALWQLYANREGISEFSAMTSPFSQALNEHHEALGEIPLIPYGMDLDSIGHLADSGAFLLKIKIGSNPGGRNDYGEMLEWDKNRLSAIHTLLQNRETPYTESGKLLYYLDANGRYDTPERLEAFLDYADQIGALERIVLLEEPFDEEAGFEVRRFPVRIAGDESAHCREDAVRLIDELGYSAIALKPIAKTLSATLQILDAAHERNVPCFCADLTVNPLMADWNKNVACRISPLPGVKVGVVEVNGGQNYRNWNEMKTLHPTPSGSWTEPRQGVYRLDETFYQTSGGVLLPPEKYQAFLDV